LKKKVWGIKVGECWRKLYNKEIMQLFGSSNVPPIFRIRQLNWIGHVDRMVSKSKVSQVFNNNPQRI
jgi:hypothetical protein